MKKYTTACAIVINERGEILLIKRGREPFKGHWALISGIGESKKDIKPEVGVVEEVNCDLQTESFKGKYLFSMPVKGDNSTNKVAVFVGKVNEDEIKVRPPYSVEYKWASKKKKENFKNLAFEHTKIVEKYLKKRSG